MKRTVFFLYVSLLAGSGLGQQPTFTDPLLDRMAGNWVLQGRRRRQANHPRRQRGVGAGAPVPTRPRSPAREKCQGRGGIRG